jgi:hypothetical protein
MATRHLGKRRIALGIVTAWLLPSILFAGLVMARSCQIEQHSAFSHSDAAFDPIGFAFYTLVVGPVMGLLAGWPFLLPALGAWFLLHRRNRANPMAAALVGLLCGLAVDIPLSVAGQMIWLLACPLLGLVTGLSVWWAAYGGASRPSAP